MTSRPKEREHARADEYDKRDKPSPNPDAGVPNNIGGPNLQRWESDTPERRIPSKPSKPKSTERKSP